MPDAPAVRDHLFTMLLTEEEHAALKELAEARGTTMAVLVRAAVARGEKKLQRAWTLDGSPR
jgi:hypothetical protein